MAKSIRGRRRFSSRLFRSAPYPLPSYRKGVLEKEGNPKKPAEVLEKKDWKDATCSVCMEFPHNAVLLLCSSHDKGCRPYMCGTSYRYSNCLDQFKKAYMKVLSPQGPQDQDIGSGIFGWPPSAKSEVTELACPLCRGQVKGWTVVEPAREYLNSKKRSCMQDNCSFVGTYKELRKHVRAEHPSARPHEVDPVVEQRWRMLEREREREDVLSTIHTTMPGAVVLGDYVIEGSNGGFYTDDEGGVNGDGNRGGIDGDWLRLMILLESIGHPGGTSFASRLRMARRGYRASEGEGGGARFSLVASGADDDVAVAGASEGDDVEAPVIRQGRGVVRRRRRRHRSRGSRG